MTPLVSVIIPTYNRPQKLRRALRSVTQQTSHDWEVIVVNDGGEDAYHVASCYSHVTYLEHQGNRGLPAARNTGLAAATGRYIAYLDDDDWYYSQHVKLLTYYAEAVGRRWLYSDADYLDRNGETALYMSRHYDRASARLHNFTPVCCVLHERSLLEQVGGFDETLKNHEDWDMWLRMAEVCDPLHIPAVTCCIDRSGETMGSNRDAMIAGYELVKARYSDRVAV